MSAHDFLLHSLIYLGAAVISVPIASRLGLGSVLGYLIAGIVIGPFALGLVGDQSAVMHFAEFGVVMMLFLVGLELKPALLWSLRRSVIGLGGSQVILTACAVGLMTVVLLDLDWRTATALGLTVALSSTAIVLQSLAEKGLLKSSAGQNAFAVLLFQDIAVIPIMALFPLLAVVSVNSASLDSSTLIDQFPGWVQLLIIMAVMAGIVLAGRWISFPIFRYIAETRLREIFTAFALLLVIAMALAMELLGLSAALGTFLAGVVLAESEFRHELEVDIEPFKGLLLGLFFISVGANIDFWVVRDNPALVFVGLAMLLAIKLAVLAGLARVFNLAQGQRLLFTCALAQGGEFAFVLGGFGLQSGVFTPDQVNLLTVVVALSMLCTPLLLLLHDALLRRASSSETGRQFDEISDEGGKVIIAGYGRFGQIAGRLLASRGHHATILDASPSQIDLVRGFGNKVFFGDASRLDLLVSAGAAEAKLLIIAIDEPDKTLEIIRTVKKNFPKLKMLVRTIDRRHTYEVLKLDVEFIQRETFESALNLGVEALKHLGHSEKDSVESGKTFRSHDEESVQILSELWGDDKSYGVAVRQRLDDLSQVLEADRVAERDSDVPAPGIPTGGS